MNNPIFIRGCISGGTTLLFKILASNNFVSAIPIELHMFRDKSVMRKWFKHAINHTNKKNMYNWYTTNKNKHEIYDLKEHSEKIMNYINNYEMKDLFDFFLSFEEDKIPLEKTPIFTKTKQLREHFPNSIIIGVIRNPLDNIYSIYNRRIKKGTHEERKNKSITTYLDNYHSLLKTFNKIDILVSYESICKNPIQNIKKLYDLTGLDKNINFPLDEIKTTKMKKKHIDKNFADEIKERVFGSERWQDVKNKIINLDSNKLIGEYEWE